MYGKSKPLTPRFFNDHEIVERRLTGFSKETDITLEFGVISFVLCSHTASLVLSLLSAGNYIASVAYEDFGSFMK